MSLRRQLLLSFWIQGMGAASVLLATLLLGASFGPEVQGGFSRVNAEIEFVAAFAMFGLPQALFFHVKSGRLDIRSALRWAAATALLALPIGAGYAAAEHAQAGILAAILLGLAVGAYVAHGQVRARSSCVKTARGSACSTGAAGVGARQGGLDRLAGVRRVRRDRLVDALVLAYGSAAPRPGIGCAITRRRRLLRRLARARSLRACGLAHRRVVDTASW